MGRRTEIEHILDRLGGVRAKMPAPPPQAIVTHPLNVPELHRLFPGCLDRRPRTLGFMLEGMDIIPCDLVPRWFKQWQPPDWGPLWELGPEDEASLRPLGFGVVVEHVGRPAFWLMDRNLVYRQPDLLVARVLHLGRQKSGW